MSRRLKVSTTEIGMLELFLVYSTGGIWEPEWRPLRETPLSPLFTYVSEDLIQHALLGWTSPLVKRLGIPPEGALRKMPKHWRICSELRKCPGKSENCSPLMAEMPVCFTVGEPLTDEILRLWHAKVHVLVVDGEENG